MRHFTFMKTDANSNPADARNLSVAVDYLSRPERQSLLGQKGKVIWLFGLSGSGKSTLANVVERRLREQKFFTYILDGDNIRQGLNRDLGFSDADRTENIRRIAEVSRLFADAGVIVFNAFITPREDLRALARKIIGDQDLLEVYVECSFEKCASRDVKGLYAKAAAGGIQQFTGRDSGFETPANPDIIINTEHSDIAKSADDLYRYILPRIRPDEIS